jgi:histidyl-tRNA synthetase
MKFVSRLKSRPDPPTIRSYSKFAPIRGTHDLIGYEHKKRDHLIETMYRISSKYNFERISTPILENEAVFKRTLGLDSDVISKEMYSFVKSTETLCLRPENTAGVVRSLISTPSLLKTYPLRFCYDGPMFRYERPQKGRYRQFHQFGVELFGIQDTQADIEVIDMAKQMLDAFEIKDVTLEINTIGVPSERLRYKSALKEYLSGFKIDLSDQSKDRLEKDHIMRILDSKDEQDQQVVKNAPKMMEYLEEDTIENFEQVKAGLDTLGIKYVHNPFLVRGLDYYTNTCFEFKIDSDKLGLSKATVIAGGRYDGLVQLMDGPSTPAVGWACGIERLSLLVNPKFVDETLITVITIRTKQLVYMEGIKLVSKLRRDGFRIHHLDGLKVSKLFEKANQIGTKFVLILGEDEISSGNIVVKNMKTGEQESISISKVNDFLVKIY